MKTLLKLAAIAAAFGLAPAAASGQAQTPATAANQAAPAAAAPGAAPAAAAATNAATPAPAQLAPQAGIGQPDGRAALQDQFTPIGEEALWFHNAILQRLAIGISIFVLILLLIVIVRFRRGANPNPTRTSHNTMLEVIWTLVPVIILVAIAIPSIRLLAHQYSPPRADLTVKITGHQWQWEYEYPDNGVHFFSRMLTDEEARAAHEPRQLGVDHRLVVPAGAVVKAIVTSEDVIHSWGVPGFWVKIDAVPGRLNETWFRVDRPGVYYGVCYELCGDQHGFMPIEVEVLPREQFARWVASQGGHMGGARPAAAAAMPAGAAATPAPTNSVETAAAPATANQAETR
jgi:cytochrome c oxidase subunit 2